MIRAWSPASLLVASDWHEIGPRRSGRRARQHKANITKWIDNNLRARTVSRARPQMVRLCTMRGEPSCVRPMTILGLTHDVCCVVTPPYKVVKLCVICICSRLQLAAPSIMALHYNFVCCLLPLARIVAATNVLLHCKRKSAILLQSFWPYRRAVTSKMFGR